MSFEITTHCHRCHKADRGDTQPLSGSAGVELRPPLDWDTIRIERGGRHLTTMHLCDACAKALTNWVYECHP